MSDTPEIFVNDLVTLLRGIGYQVVRKQRTCMRLEKMTPTGIHRVTFPNLSPLASGTLNDILTTISRWNQIPTPDLLSMLKK
jgi:hypothetical protein